IDGQVAKLRGRVMMTHRVSFFDDSYPPLDLKAGASLSAHPDVRNKPLLFGCRTGVCGTCLVRVEGDLKAPSDHEREMLELLAPGDRTARLACQLAVTCDIRIGRHPAASDEIP